MSVERRAKAVRGRSRGAVNGVIVHPREIFTPTIHDDLVEQSAEPKHRNCRVKVRPHGVLPDDPGAGGEPSSSRPLKK